MTKINIEKLAEDTCAIIESDGAIVFQQKEHLRHFAEAYAKQQRQEQENSCPECGCHFTGKFPFKYTTPPDQSKLIESQAREIAELKIWKENLVKRYGPEYEKLQSHINVLRKALEVAKPYVTTSDLLTIEKALNV